MLGELSNLPPEVLCHHMASLHSKDNPQGSPSLLLVQLLFTPHVLSNIWQSERYEFFFSIPYPGCQGLCMHGFQFWFKGAMSRYSKSFF